jgi:hypothetical protein
MWIEPETVSIEDALKVEYANPESGALHRVEFTSERTKDWSISLQAQSDSRNISDIRVGGSWPHKNKN